jgi:hypothetical protein
MNIHFLNSTQKHTYSLVSGVYFHLLKCLFKLDHPRQATVQESHTPLTRPQHSCSLNNAMKTWTTGYKPHKTPHYCNLVVYTPSNLQPPYTRALGLGLHACILAISLNVGVYINHWNFVTCNKNLPLFYLG